MLQPGEVLRQLNLPLWKSPKYAGYSKSTDQHFLEHRQRETSWFAILVGSAFRVEFGDDAFSMDDYVVCFIASDKEALGQTTN